MAVGYLSTAVKEQCCKKYISLNLKSPNKKSTEIVKAIHPKWTGCVLLLFNVLGRLAMP